MLRLLVKYDMKAISKKAVPMFVASGIVSLLCCAVLYFTFGFADGIDSLYNAFMLTGGLSLICAVTIIAMFAVVLISAIHRYYLSVFSDEGYLFMTIPVTRRTFLNSKIISSVIWFLLSAAMAWICAFVSLVLPVLLYDTGLIANAINLIKDDAGIEKGDAVFGIVALVIRIVISVAGIVKDVMLIIASITIGSALIKRLKIAFSVAIYFLITFFEELFINTVSAILHWITVDQQWLTLAFNSVFELLVIGIVFTAAYMGTNFILEKKLNLE